MVTASSKCSDITCGVPQGSMLGLFLFLIYVNDIYIYIYTSALKVPFNLFTDDRCLFYSTLTKVMILIKYKLSF